MSSKLVMIQVSYVGRGDYSLVFEYDADERTGRTTTVEVASYPRREDACYFAEKVATSEWGDNRSYNFNCGVHTYTRR